MENNELENLNLKLENDSLETDLKLKGGEFYKSEDIDPVIENSFLRRVTAFEEADKEELIQIKSLFPNGFDFPSVESLTKQALEKKIAEIENILFQQNIEFGFAHKLPLDVFYNYLVNDFIPNESVSAAVNAGFTWTIDGCDGSCEDCFQLKYCTTGQKIIAEE